jgi:hypothetical protein
MKGLVVMKHKAIEITNMIDEVQKLSDNATMRMKLAGEEARDLAKPMFGWGAYFFAHGILLAWSTK